MITIDGSKGEGGGQILRSSLALSLVTGQPFRIINIRAGRPKPGLMRQHLTAVNAAAEVGRAEVDGARIGSQCIVFVPRKVSAGSYHFSVGTAGSCTLVLQTILPGLMTAASPSKLVLEGGTHNPHAPPFDFLERAFLPLIGKMGPKISARLQCPGFYPSGGGRITVSIDPSEKLAPLHIPERGKIVSCSARAIVARLPRQIAERELEVVRKRLGWSEKCCSVEESSASPGPGNALCIEIQSEHVTEVFTGFGERGVRAEVVAAETAREAEEYLQAEVPVGRYLADQLLLPMAQAGGGSFRTLSPTLHATTCATIIRQFLAVDIAMHQGARNQWEIRITTKA